MNTLRFKTFAEAVVLTAALAGVSRAQVVPAIFKDKFEGGTAGSVVGAPWGKNDITQTLYQSATNPFATGSLYADLLDLANSSAPSVAVRLMSSGNNTTNPLIAGKVTSFSFDFFEPTRVGDAGSVIAGYYREQANVDLNSGGRNYTATLREGNLGPQLGVAGSGGTTTYALDTVNTLFILANDSADAVVDYEGTGHTIAPSTADVWLTRGTEAPVFVFSVNKGNTVAPNNTPVVGVGFRTVNADIEQLFVDNVLVMPGATLSRSGLDAPVAGNYNGDAIVDGADYLEWQRQYGATAEPKYSGADGDGSGVIDDGDLAVWRSHLGQSNSVAAVSNVPEPCLAALLLPLVGFFRFRGAVRTHS